MGDKKTVGTGQWETKKLRTATRDLIGSFLIHIVLDDHVLT